MIICLKLSTIGAKLRLGAYGFLRALSVFLSYSMQKLFHRLIKVLSGIILAKYLIFKNSINKMRNFRSFAFIAHTTP